MYTRLSQGEQAILLIAGDLGSIPSNGEIQFFFCQKSVDENGKTKGIHPMPDLNRQPRD
jgi:hypothetical protein